MSVPVLSCENLEAGYGPFRALFGISFEVAEGTAVALIGPNGAGKSTVARVASGLVAPSAGRVLVNGVEMTGKAPHEFAEAGIAHAPEGRAVFASLTVEENLELAFRESLGRKGVAAALEEAYQMFPRLKERRKQLAGTLSGGEQRILTLARVMILRPTLLIADELSLGLAPMITTEVYRILERIKAAGCALLIVEQHMDYALALSDEVLLLRQGEVTFRGPPSELDRRSASLLSESLSESLSENPPQQEQSS